MKIIYRISISTLLLVFPILANAAPIANCLTDFSNSVNAALEEYDLDLDRCNGALLCTREASLSLNQNINTAVASYETCTQNEK